MFCPFSKMYKSHCSGLALLQICEMLPRTFHGADCVCSNLEYVFDPHNYLCGIACSVVFSNLRYLSGLLKSPCIYAMFSPSLRNIFKYILSLLLSKNSKHKANMAMQSHLCRVLRKQHVDWHFLCRLSLKKTSVTAECLCLVLQNFHLDWCTFYRSLRTIFSKYFLSLPLSQNSVQKSVMQRGIAAVCFQK